MNRKKVVNYVKRQNKALSEYKVGPFQIIIKDPLTANINIRDLFNNINALLPKKYTSLVDIIYIGDFTFLNKQEVNALYMDGAIYISNQQDNTDDLKDDVVHEISHAVEEKYGDFIYGDGEIKGEFLLKRDKLKKILQHQDYNIRDYDFYKIKYEEKFDSFLYEEVGYDALRIMTVDILLGPYSITSLREYFARGFEEYYIGNKFYLKEVCPYIYKKLLFLEEEVNNYEF